MATAHNAFTLSEAYGGSLCSALRTLIRRMAFPSRQMRGGAKKQKCGCDLTFQAGRMVKSSLHSTQTTSVKQFLPFPLSSISRLFLPQSAKNFNMCGEARPVSYREDEPRPSQDCAWCLKEQGRDPGEGSHGVCSRHAEQILADWRTRRGPEQENRHEPDR